MTPKKYLALWIVITLKASRNTFYIYGGHLCLLHRWTIECGSMSHLFRWDKKIVVFVSLILVLVQCHVRIQYNLFWHHISRQNSDVAEQILFCHVRTMTEHSTLTWQNKWQLVMSCHICFVLTWQNTIQWHDRTQDNLFCHVMYALFWHDWTHSTMTWQNKLSCVLSCHVCSHMQNTVQWQEQWYDITTCSVIPKNLLYHVM